MIDHQLYRRLQQPTAVIAGIINTTPDSFSDGGLYNQADQAIEHGLKLAADGAELLDIGGESTRPGAQPVPVEKELDRVIPVIEGLSKRTDTMLSVDTSKPEVMQAAIEAGVCLVNDVRAGTADRAWEVIARHKVMVCIMHMQGEPQVMQKEPEYENVVDQVIGFLQQRMASATNSGVVRDAFIVDPGIGFGKTLQHNLGLLASIGRIASHLQVPVLIGVSRKSLIEKQLGRAVDQRLAASLGLAVQAMLDGAKILRVHDVKETVDAVRMVEAVSREKNHD